MGVPAAKTFTAVLEPLQSGLGWVIARIPFDVPKAWPVRKGLRVRGEISSATGRAGGFAFRTSLFAFSSGGGHFLLVNKKMQAGAGARTGAKVRIRLEPDLEERPALVPAELAGALKGDRRLLRWFDALSPSMRREIGKWVDEPKGAGTRLKRAEKMAERLMLTMEGEEEPPPVLRAAFLRQPRALEGWNNLTAVQRRHSLLAIFYYESVEARERRAAKVVEAALRAAGKEKGNREQGTGNRVR
jgi:uncharacterized protein YdeI (YjbR/CyaY-like superfamily)